MKAGLFVLPLIGPADIIKAIGEAAEECQVDSIWLAEPHLLVLPQYSSPFPYAADGKLPEDYGHDGELDGLLTLGFLASVTSRVRLGIGVCVVPQRNPVFTAKDVTTLDHLSNGRFDFGVGIGWLAEEFSAVGVSFSRRADRCREYIDVMRTLWVDPLARHEGEFCSLPESRQLPSPVQKPHPPIYFGGNSLPALRRVADLGQGWIPWDPSPDDVKRGIDRLTELLEARGRSRREVQVTVAATTEKGPIDVVAHADAGVDQLVAVVPPVPSLSEIGPMLDRFVAEILEPAHQR